MMFSSMLLILHFILILSISEDEMKTEDVEKLGKRAKALACSLLSSSYLSKRKKKEKEIRQLLEKMKIIKDESEANEKISQFMSALCYTKINEEAVANILSSVSPKKNHGTPKEDYNHLFEFDKKVKFKKIKKVMNEVTTLINEMNEEENDNDDGTGDLNFDESLKDINKKMIRNKKYDKKEKEEIIDNKDNNKKNKKKKKKEKDSEDVKGKNKQNVNKKFSFDFNFKNISFDIKNFSFDFKKFSNDVKKFFEKIDFTLIWGFVISLAIIIIFPFIFIQQDLFKDNKNKIITNTKKGNTPNKSSKQKEKKIDDNDDIISKEKID